jgi:hypothetical protein
MVVKAYSWLRWTGLVSPFGTSVGSNGGITDDNRVPTGPGDNDTVNFSDLWTGFTALSAGNLTFRNVGMFISPMASPITGSNSLLFQKITPSELDYVTPLPLTTGGACNSAVSLSISPANPTTAYPNSTDPTCIPGDHHPFCSNQFNANDFFRFVQDGSVNTIGLKLVSGNALLDLYIFNKDYSFENPADVLNKNIDYISIGQTKQINVSSFSPGVYMLNVFTNTASGNPSTSQYQLFVNGAQVCP